MIELVFVIVILGVLAAVAIPRFAATRDDAQIAKGRSDILTIRSGIINERQARMFRGDSSYADDLNSNVGADQPLFGDILARPITSKAATVDGGWRKTANFTYAFRVMGVDVAFTYDPTNGTFECDRDVGTSCRLLTE